MIKKILIWIINLYQKTPTNLHGYCKHVPTCSQYAKEAIMEHGVIKGGYLAVKRIAKCNPFGTYGYDPVPKRRRK